QLFSRILGYFEGLLALLDTPHFLSGPAGQAKEQVERRRTSAPRLTGSAPVGVPGSPGGHRAPQREDLREGASPVQELAQLLRNLLAVGDLPLPSCVQWLQTSVPGLEARLQKVADRVQAAPQRHAAQERAAVRRGRRPLEAPETLDTLAERLR